VVHALAGTVQNINAAAKTITVITDDGSGGTFKDITASLGAIEFDKVIRADATEAGAFKDKGVRAIVYYCGDGDVRTVVAVRSLGTGPFTKSSGTVVKFDKRQHLLTIQDKSGTTQSFKITQGTVAETDAGAAEGLKFDPNKGEQIRVTATEANGTMTALFINGVLGS
jgi:hypothetical protein